jgi:MATE family multidrug resistance protein
MGDAQAKISSGYGAHFRATMKLSVPLVASNLAAVAYGVTDTIMLGWYGIDELAAGVLASQVFYVFLLWASGFAHGLAPLVAEALGGEDGVRARRILRMGFWVTFAFITISIPLVWQTGWLLRALGQDAALSDLAQQYMRIAMWNLYPVLAFFVLRAYFSALERANIVMWTTMVGIVLNAVLNYIFIFGNFGAPELGLRGAAIATLGTGMLSFIVPLVFLVLDPELKQTRALARIWRPDWEIFAEVYRLGWPISLMLLAETALFSISALMMGWIGTVELAAHGIALQITTVIFMIPLGISMAASARVGRAVGRQDAGAVRRASVMALAMGLSVAVVATLVLWLIPDALVNVFLDPAKERAPEILRYGVLLVLVAAVFHFVDAVQVLIVGILRGLKDARVPMIVAVVSYLPIGLGASYYLGFVRGYDGVGIWSGMAIGLLVASIGLAWRCWRQIEVRYGGVW